MAKGLQPESSTHQESCRDQSQLHIIKEALRKHMLPLLTFTEIAALGSTCTDWHHIIALTHVQQLPARCLEGLLPPAISSKRPFCKVLQQQGSLMAKLKGREPLNPVVLQLDVASNRVCKLAWSPQTDLDMPSQWIQVMQRPAKESSGGKTAEAHMIATVVDLHACQRESPCSKTPLQPARTMLNHLHSAQEPDDMSVTWTIDGRQIAILMWPFLMPTYPEVDRTSCRLLLVNANSCADISASSHLSLKGPVRLLSHRAAMLCSGLNISQMLRLVTSSQTWLWLIAFRICKCYTKRMLLQICCLLRLRIWYLMAS